MTDMLESGMTWLRGKRKAFMGHVVTYVAGDDEIELTATIGRTLYRATDEFGVEIKMAVRDYLITADDLIVGSLYVVPEPGHKIEDGEYTYEVMNPGPGEPCWRYTDAYRGTLRIHTKEIATP